MSSKKPNNRSLSWRRREFLLRQGAGPVRTEQASRGHPAPRLRPGSECGLARGHPPTNEDGDPSNCDTKGNAAQTLQHSLTGHQVKRPMPSMDSTVADRTASVSACTTCAMHSVPARVVNAYWNGAVAHSIAGHNCWAIVRGTNRLNKSLATVP